MQPRGVLITAKLNDEVYARCSGINISNWVITHGTIVIPLINKNISDANFNSSQISFEVLIQKNYSTCNNELKHYKTSDTHSYNATLEGFYKHKYISHIIKTSLSSWTYSRTEDENEEVVKGLSLFVLLKLSDLNSDNTSNKLKLENESFQLGMDILVESTPFAATPFFNSWSKGVVSKVLDAENQLILTDARTAVGSEGAPIYS